MRWRVLSWQGALFPAAQLGCFRPQMGSCALAAKQLRWQGRLAAANTGAWVDAAVLCCAEMVFASGTCVR
jgi:hypothetical protein